MRRKKQKKKMKITSYESTTNVQKNHCAIRWGLLVIMAHQITKKHIWLVCMCLKIMQPWHGLALWHEGTKSQSRCFQKTSRVVFYKYLSHFFGRLWFYMINTVNILLRAFLYLLTVLHCSNIKYIRNIHHQNYARTKFGIDINFIVNIDITSVKLMFCCLLIMEIRWR